MRSTVLSLIVTSQGMMEELLFRAILAAYPCASFWSALGTRALRGRLWSGASESWLVAPRPGDHDRRRPHPGPALYGDRPALDGDWDAHGMGFLRGIVPRSEHSQWLSTQHTGTRQVRSLNGGLLWTRRVRSRHDHWKFLRVSPFCGPRRKASFRDRRVSATGSGRF